MFPQRQLEKPGPVSQDRCEVEKVIEYQKAVRTGVTQYKVRCLGYSLEDDQWINAKDISSGILQHFCTKRRLESTLHRHRSHNGGPGRYQRDQTLAMIQNE